MKKHELLTPRFKVIADYPEMGVISNYKVGDILTVTGGPTVLNQNGEIAGACEFESYPHLFKKLDWWEERSKAEMPKYLKAKDGKIGVVEKWTMSKDNKSEYGTYATVRGYCWFVSNTNEPITEEEFNSLNKKIV